MSFTLATFALVGLCAGAPADPPKLLRGAIEDFEFGEHAAAAKKLAALLDPIQLQSVEDVILARQYLGACYYLLDDRSKAEAEFAKLLVLDSNHRLDPEVFSPALVQFFEELRARTGLGMRAGPERKPPPEDAPRPPPPPPPRSTGLPAGPPPAPAVPVLPAEPPPPLGLALVPFGVGQFANGHPVRGMGFAVAEVGLLAAVVVTHLMFEDVAARGTEGPDGSLRFTSVEDADRASSLQTARTATLWSAVGVAAIGVFEALLSRP